ncbi:MAG TPA: ABC transporter ATP-binding protein [Phycisphaerales bacterium]|nr:ABC transporter ATP-binding protein [Phycisphaerales bacterium]
MIQTRELTKQYGGLVALNKLTLDIGPGEVFGFIGPNGAGKTTTMKILSCLVQPDHGSASVAGFDIGRDADQVRRNIGYMPDFLGVYDDLTVDEYLQFFAAAFGITRKNRAGIIGQVLELTDLTFKRHELVDSLSRGMQQRLGVARVLVHDPRVLFLDEPASGLDPRARIEMRSLLQELGKMGKTLLVSSHILSELAEMCTCIGIIERGTLLYAGSIQDAYERTRARSDSAERIVVTLEAQSAPATLIAARLASDERVAKATADDASRTLTIDIKHRAASEAGSGMTGHHFVIEGIINAGGRIASFQPEQVRLEDAFLKLTTGAVQ